MHFTIITNHSALKAIKRKTILTGRLLRRAEKLMEHNFDIIYRSGSENIVPNFLPQIYVFSSNSNED